MKNTLVALLFICTFSSVAMSDEWSSLSDEELCHAYYTENKRGAGFEVQSRIKLYGLKCIDIIDSEDTGKLFYASTNKELCILALDKYGNWREESRVSIRKELNSRKVDIDSCRLLTGRMTEKQKLVAQEAQQKKLLDQKKARIKQLKLDCEDIGFNDGTEAMGNCVLKLMELQGNNTPTIVTTTTSNSSQEIVDIEKQKLQAQREALKLQQDQLKAEQERVAQERRKAIQRNANKSIQQGKCLMNGGSTWDCM